MAKILFVEDEPDIRDLVLMALEDGHSVVAAETAEEGLRRATADAPDLILMDVALGEMDGWEATLLIKARPTTKDIPVIALTAHAMSGDRERYLAAGFDGYVAKPIYDEQVLLEAIERLLEQPPQ